MTTESHHGATILPGAGRSPSRRRRFKTTGMVLGLSAAVVLMGACSRQNTPNVDPALKAWFDNSYKPAIDDMSKAAAESKDIKDGCKAASDALSTHEAQITKTPDSQLTELVKGFVAERKEAYAKCVETGDFEPSTKTREIQKRVNELSSRGRAS